MFGACYWFAPRRFHALVFCSVNAGFGFGNLGLGLQITGKAGAGQRVRVAALEPERGAYSRF